jgi:hypothetical protein
MFGRTPAAPPDPLSEARATIDKLAAALANAKSDAADATTDYDRLMHDFVARGIGKEAPSQERQRAATARIASLERLLTEARARLGLLTQEAADAERLAAIKASGSQVAALTTTAETKLADFEAAIAMARRAEAELIAILFNGDAGLKQHSLTREHSGMRIGRATGCGIAR